MRHSHDMPFGAQMLDDGCTRFRLWAPKAARVDLCIQQEEDEVAISLSKREHGWFELITEVPTGSRYKFQIDSGQKVPDPASRFQPEDVHDPSEVVDPRNFAWSDDRWSGRPWAEVVLYELHVGAFTREGTFAAVESKLDYLKDLGITAIELMPVSDFSGKRNWGYDGVLPFAPDSSYGSPNDLKHLVQAAHKKGLMIFLDVVYNHFGPEGNYIRAYAPQFFTDRHCTPWGDGINYDGAESRVVRDFVIHNAIYWLDEYQFDGLRLDAVHAIADDSNPNILIELAEKVRAKFGADRRVHLVLENEHNCARYLGGENATPYNAQWNDDIHHALHVITTQETDGYYSDYVQKPIWQLGRCLAEGFAFQNDPSAYRDGARRGEVSKQLSPQCFVSFLQNHDQVGNRPFGDRISNNASAAALKAAMAILLLAPPPPLIFMGEEFHAQTPFLFFCDFKGELATAVMQGRRDEFKRFSKFSDPDVRSKIPDPNANSTFAASTLNWDEINLPEHACWLRFYRELLARRHKFIFPLLSKIVAGAASFKMFDKSGLIVQWKLNDGRTLHLKAILGESDAPQEIPQAREIIYSSGFLEQHEQTSSSMRPWDVFWYLEG